MGESELQILISAVDEASGTIAEISDSVSGMAEATATAADAAGESFAQFGLQVNETTGEIESAILSQQQSFDLLTEVLQTDSAEIQQLILDEGISFQDAAAVITEANATIEASSEQAATSSAGAYAGLAAIAGIAFLGIKGAIGGAVSSAKDWDEASAQIVQILKDTGSAIPLSQIQAYAQQVQATTLFSQQDVLASESLIFSHKNLQGSYESLTNVAADLATKMGSNLPNATRMLTNALTDPVAGLNQLIRQGNIDFPAATVTMIQNMAKVGNTAGADALILQTLQGSIGGVATAAAGAPGASLTQLSNQMSALGTAIGNDLLPLLDILAKDLGPIIQHITVWAEAHPKLTDAIVIGVVALTALLLILGIVGVAIITITPVVEALTVAALGFGAALAFLAANPIVLIIAAIALIVIAIYELITHWKEVSAFIQAELKVLSDNWSLMWQNMGDFLGNIWASIKNTIKSGINDVIGLINGMINALDSIHINIPAITIPGTKIGTPALDLGFNIPDIPMLAAGGIVYNPILAMIGEQGPEAVIPLSSLGGAGGGFGGIGSGTQIVVNINGGIFPADASSIRQIGDMLAKSITAQLRTRNYAT